MEHYEYYSHKIKRLSHDIRLAFDFNFEQLGVTGSQAMILIYVCKNESVHQNDIEQTFGLSKSSVSGIIKRMTKKELISKEIDYPYVTITPTKQGKELLEKMDEVRDQINNDLLVGFTEEEKATLKNYLDRMATNMKEGDING